LIDDDHRAVLCDFSLSCIVADITDQTSVSNSNIVEGSRNWMAPERLQGGSLTKSTDIYALGMVIYEVSNNLLFFGVPV
jgi:serine/threonine protein kinase